MDIKTVQSLEKIPDFITREHIGQMNDQQLDDMIEGIRTRRMQAQLVYRQSVADKEQANNLKIAQKMDKKAEQIIKTLATADNALEKLERYVQELRAFRIDAGLSFV